jgi:mono/diheme cytochrome c family protein
VIAVVILLVLMPLVAGSGVEPNARRGAMVFAQQKCIACHTMPEEGENAPAHFERRSGRDYTPAGMASLMWNHAPMMWGVMRQAALEIPRLTEADATNLFAYFYAGHLFERPGDAASGKRVFEGKCARCHSAPGPGKPVDEWKLTADSVELVQRLWNHAPDMSKVLKAKKRGWPQLASDELSDLLAYTQTIAARQPDLPAFSLPTGTRGQGLLETRGCTGCHKGLSALEGRLIDHSLTDVAASIWNHAPKMREKAGEVTLDEMREILAYIWSTDFFRSRGSVAEGQKVFGARCGICHGNRYADAPDLKKIDRRYTAITMVWALWNHGPKMLQEIQSQQRAWPELSEKEMTNLITFLNFRLRINR